MIVEDSKIKEVMQGVIDNFLKPKFISLGMNATGKWLESLEAHAENGTGYIRGLDYTFYLVNGRAGGNRPPIAPLIQWTQAKLGLSGNQAKSAAFAISTKIAREGTDYYPEGTDLLEVLESPEVAEYIRIEMQTYMNGVLSTEIKRIVWQTLS